MVLAFSQHYKYKLVKLLNVARIYPLQRPTYSGVLRTTIAALFSFLALLNNAAHAVHINEQEPENSGWSIQIDNDLLVGGRRDRDYTGGFAATISGNRVTHYPWTPEKLRSWADHQLGVAKVIDTDEHYSYHAMEWGIALFTPRNIARTTSNPSDRPYASLFFLNSTEQTVIPDRKLSLKSSLTFGLLGLDLAESIQRGIHSTLGNIQPEGWRHQISSGGELTFKYGLSFQKAAYQHAFSNGMAQEFNWTSKADIGFNTGAGVGFNWRVGRINTPWWTFNPHQSEYINLGSNVSSGQGLRTQIVKERYFYAGATANYTFYNAFTQGQFRRSTNTVNDADIVRAGLEYWTGISIELGSRWRLDTFLRARTRELKLAEATAPTWGGLIFSKTYR